MGVVSANELSDIEALLSLDTLTHLDAAHNAIARVSDLSRLRRLERLDLSHNRVEAISELGLSGLSRLHFLALNNNRILHIDGLSALPRLEALYLDCNKIRKLSQSELSGVAQSLSELSLRSNGMRSLEYLDILEKVKVLDIAQNRLNHIHQLDVLKHLHFLFQLTLDANPIFENSKKQCLEHICKVSASLKFVGHFELAELRTELRLKSMMIHSAGDVPDAYLQPPNVYSHHSAEDGDRDGYSDISAASSAKSLSALMPNLPMQNPMGLKIQSVAHSKFKARHYKK